MFFDKIGLVGAGRGGGYLNGSLASFPTYLMVNVQTRTVSSRRAAAPFSLANDILLVGTGVGPVDIPVGAGAGKSVVLHEGFVRKLVCKNPH